MVMYRFLRCHEHLVRKTIAPHSLRGSACLGRVPPSCGQPRDSWCAPIDNMPVSPVAAPGERVDASQPGETKGAKVAHSPACAATTRSWLTPDVWCVSHSGYLNPHPVPLRDPPSPGEPFPSRLLHVSDILVCAHMTLLPDILDVVLHPGRCTETAVSR